MNKRIFGQNIVLRSYEEKDIPSIHRWMNDPETTKWMGRNFRNIKPLDVLTERVKSIISNPPDDGIFFVIADPNTDEYLGALDITSIDWYDQNGVLTIVIAEKQNRGQGLAQEALSLLLHYAFEERGLHKIELRVNEKNIGGIKCYEKVGFKIEGWLKDHTVVDEEYCDLILMGILRETKEDYLIHKMTLQPEPFEKILSGDKRMEFRLYDEKRQRITLGDSIEFTHSEDPSRTVQVKVVGYLC
jgi:RimJ/RimL family protein N-acetyltransferase